MIKFPKELYLVSNPDEVQQKAKKYYKNLIVYPSTRKNKKYCVINPYTNKLVHFGDLRYEDYTEHKDLKRRMNYLNRTSKIKGDWLMNPYSPNNLSRLLLW